MIDANTIREIIATYQKHGWVLRRVLLSPASKKAFSDLDNDLFGGICPSDSDIDAAWFSRIPQKDTGIPWEIRYMGETPFALVQNFDETDTDFEESLSEIEGRLRESMATKYGLDKSIG